MRNFRIDITGKKFKKWTVLEYAGGSYWKVQCECGFEKNVLSSNLRRGVSGSCLKCRPRASSSTKIIDLRGKKINEWTVIDYAGNYNWLCECKCGTRDLVNGNSLRRGSSKMCKRCKSLIGSTKKIKGMEGKRFGKWTVIKELPSQNGKRFFECKCACGSIKKVNGVTLRIGSSTQCKRCSLRIVEGMSAFNKLLCIYKSAARKRGLSWSLTEDQFRTLTSSACYYTGLPPSSISKSENGEYVYNGIDRLDSTAGYSIDNCVPCIGKVNVMKMRLPVDEFLNLCNMISENIKRKGLFKLTDFKKVS